MRYQRNMGLSRILSESHVSRAFLLAGVGQGRRIRLMPVPPLSAIPSKRGQSGGHQGIGIPHNLVTLRHTVLIPILSVISYTPEPEKT